MSDDRTLAVYDARAADYAARFGDAARRDAALAGFIAGLPVGGLVLDLGCGPGTWAARMIAAGLRVEGCDASAGMVAEAEKVPGLTVWQARFDEIDAESRYDGIWANFSLLHAPKSEMPAHLARLRRALKPGGLLHIGLKAGRGEARDGLGRLYSYYLPDELAGLVTAAGFTPSDTREGESEGLDGTVARWFTLLCHG